MMEEKQYIIKLSSIDLYLLKNGDYSDVESVIETITGQISIPDMMKILEKHRTSG